MKKANLLITGALSMLMLGSLGSCSDGKVLTDSGLDAAAFDSTVNNKPVKLYVLKNKAGMEVAITNFGGRVVSIMVPDRDMKMHDVVLGYDNLKQYTDSVNSPSDFGAAIGRYANRLKNGKIKIEGKEIQFPVNNFGHTLHGGPSGWQYQVYDANQVDGQTLELTMNSPDGDNGFPGNVVAKVTYKVTDDNALDCTYEATTDKETVINMTNHSYFNLNGDPSVDCLTNELYINSDYWTESDSTYMTTGREMIATGNPMDFHKAHPLADYIGEVGFDQIKNANGYDHNWILNTYKDGKGDDKKVAASLYSPITGIFLQVYTNEPGIQVYTGNFLEGKVQGKHGIAYPQRSGVCLETQKYPDSPNHPEWPSPYLKPGEKYYSHQVFKFSTK